MAWEKIDTCQSLFLIYSTYRCITLSEDDKPCYRGIPRQM